MKDPRLLTQSLNGRWYGHYGTAPCPVCQPERRKDQSALSISKNNGTLLLRCFKNGCEFADIVRALKTPFVGCGQDEAALQIQHAKNERTSAVSLRQARNLWNSGKSIEGTEGEAYLRMRAITCSLPSSLRWISDTFHGPSQSRCGAMLGDVSAGGIHRTFFDRHGARLDKCAKMMLGPCSTGAICLSKTSGPLLVCEGIETGLSVLSGLVTQPVSVWAALSTSGMKSLHLPQRPAQLIVATDGDQPGRQAGEILATRAYRLGWSVSLMPAPEGQDWNDVLQGKTPNE